MRVTARFYLDFNKLHDQKELIDKLTVMLNSKHAHLLKGVSELIGEIQEQAVDENSVPTKVVYLTCNSQPSSKECSY
jgi:hypothetical protein